MASSAWDEMACVCPPSNSAARARKAPAVIAAVRCWLYVTAESAPCLDLPSLQHLGAHGARGGQELSTVVASHCMHSRLFTFDGSGARAHTITAPPPQPAAGKGVKYTLARHRPDDPATAARSPLLATNMHQRDGPRRAFGSRPRGRKGRSRGYGTKPTPGIAALAR